MSNPKFSACEQIGLVFVNKVMQIVKFALTCSKSVEEQKLSLASEEISGSPTEVNTTKNLGQAERVFAQKFLDLLSAINDEVQKDTSFREENLVETFGTGSLSSDFNITSFEADLDQVTSPTESSRGINKIQNLELIKVAVLIFVISIIMLTTCRMVFQLFVRFRPEKPRM